MNPLLSDQHRHLLRGSEVFAGLDDAELDVVLARAAWCSVPGGRRLYSAKEPSDALYILKSGSVGLFDGEPESDDWRFAGMIGPGGSIGAIGLLAQMPRKDTAQALRDSEVLRIDHAAFDELLRAFPAMLLALARNSTRRLLARAEREAPGSARTFALLGHDPAVATRELAGKLAAALAPFGHCEILDRATGEGHDSNWFAEREARTRYLIYVDSGDDPLWRRLCLRQADVLVLVADASQAASPWQGTTLDQAGPRHRPRHLLLMHPGDRVEYGAASRWLDGFRGSVRHHHLVDDSDTARVARLLAGKAIGLVLSGGGARGFAQIGVIRALREAGIEIDAVGGSSIGSIIGAGVAMGWDDDEMLRRNRRAFVQGKPLSDWTLPFVALTRGARTARLLREEFGDIDVADLRLPYFCMSTNLTRGCAVAHRRGLLWGWLRASSAVPGILPPVFLGGEVFADGALLNNLPTDEMRADGIGEIIAIDISGEEALVASVDEYSLPSALRVLLDHIDEPRRPWLVSILLRAGMLNTGPALDQRRALASRVIRPELNHIDLLDWNAYDRAIEAGYVFAREVLTPDSNATLVP